MMVTLVPLCFTWPKTLIIHTKPGHHKTVVEGSSACASFSSVWPSSQILVSIIKQIHSLAYNRRHNIFSHQGSIYSSWATLKLQSNVQNLHFFNSPPKVFILYLYHVLCFNSLILTFCYISHRDGGVQTHLSNPSNHLVTLKCFAEFCSHSENIILNKQKAHLKSKSPGFWYFVLSNHSQSLEMW